MRKFKQRLQERQDTQRRTSLKELRFRQNKDNKLTRDCEIYKIAKRVELRVNRIQYCQIYISNAIVLRVKIYNIIEITNKILTIYIDSKV